MMLTWQLTFASDDPCLPIGNELLVLDARGQVIVKHRPHKRPCVQGISSSVVLRSRSSRSRWSRDKQFIGHLNVTHPFTLPVVLEPAIAASIDSLVSNVSEVVHLRLQALQFWEAEAHRLLPASLRLINAQPDPYLRRLLKGCGDDQTPVLGQVCHM